MTVTRGRRDRRGEFGHSPCGRLGIGGFGWKWVLGPFDGGADSIFMASAASLPRPLLYEASPGVTTIRSSGAANADAGAGPGARLSHGMDARAVARPELGQWRDRTS